MNRNAIHRAYNAQSVVYDKADELGIRQQLTGYSQMTPAQRRAVSLQVLRLVQALGANADTVKMYMLPPYSVFDTLEYRQQAYAAPTPAAERNPYASYHPNASSMKDRLATQRDNCRYYIDKLKQVKEELERVKEELERIKKENTRLEKENAALIELLPGRGGYRKRTTRRKRH